MILKMILAYITALFTGITLRTPPAAWMTVGLAGMLGWTASELLTLAKVPELVATSTGAVVIGIFAEILARLQKQPVTVYIVSGIIPLVPGTVAYNSMLQFLEKNFPQGLSLAFRALLIATYLAIGLAVVPLIARNLKRFWHHWSTLFKR